MRAARLIILLTLLSAILTSASGPTFAAPLAQSNVQLAATGGYGSDGAYLIGEWFPVRVTLTNPAGGTARRVRVAVDSLGDGPTRPLETYSREVDLPAQSRKEVTLYAYSTTFNRIHDVRLLEGNTQLNKVMLTLSPYEQQANLLVGVLSSDTSLLNALNGEGLGYTEYAPSSNNYSSSSTTSASVRATILHMGLADLPSQSNALDSLGIVIVDDVDTGTLDASQKAALTAWVGRGGMLVGLGRPGGANALLGIADLLPVTLGDPKPLSALISLGDLIATPITPTGQVLAPAASLRTGRDVSARTLALQDGTVLAAISDLGRGHVAYLGLSPAITPLKGWDGTTRLFKRIFAEHPVRISQGAQRRIGSYSGVFSFYGDMFDIPGLDLPSEGLLTFFLLTYIVVVGPINFIVLRRMRRGELAWLTVPLLVLVFSIGAYIVGYGSKGGDLLTVRSNIVYTAPGLPQASVTHFFGIFSPQRGTYDLEVAADSAISEVSSQGYGIRPDNATLVTGNGDAGPTRLSSINVNTLSLRAFMSESALPAESPLEANLYLAGDAIEGTVRNRSTTQMADVALVRGAAVQLIGVLAPGQETNVRLSFTRTPFAPGSPERLLQAPPGVNISGSPYYYNERGVSDAQRRYNRQVQLLDAGLNSLLTTTAPDDMEVIVLAWGPSAPSGFAIPGRTSRSEELNLWTTVLPVRGDGPVKPKLESNIIPFWVYAAGQNLPRRDSAAAINSTIELQPYADMVLRLPANTQPDSLRLDANTTTGDTVSMLGYNVRTGKWDTLATLSGKVVASHRIEIPNPRDYTGPAGNITLRFQPGEGSPQGVGFTPLSLSLNTTNAP